MLKQVRSFAALALISGLALMLGPGFAMPIAQPDPVLAAPEPVAISILSTP